MYRLTLLGGVLLDGPDGPVAGRATQQRRLALLALLGSAGTTGRTRDRVVSWLWPETDAQQARQHLSHSLYVLRKALGEDSIHTASEHLRVERSLIDVDVLAFEEAVERGDLEASVNAYAGPFLDGFFISEAPEFERWVEDERRRLGSLYAHSLEELARGSDVRGDHSASAEWWSRLVAHDPYNSAAVVCLMEALASVGDPANAIQCAQDHIRLLGEQFGMGPPEEVVAKIGELKGRKRRWDASGSSDPATDVGVRAAPGTPNQMSAGSRPFVRRAVLVSVAAVAGLAILWSAISSPSTSVDFVPNAVMVGAAENLTGDPSLDDMSRYATYILEGGLAGIDKVRVVTAVEANDVRTAIERVDHLAGVDLVREMARQTQAGLVVESSFLVQANTLLLEARLIDAAEGEVLEGVRAEAAVTDPVVGIQALRDQVMILVATRLNLGDEYLGSYARGQSYAAWQEVDTARRLMLEDGREREALALLYQALAIDSTFDAAVGLAMIWHLNFGEYSRADSLASVLDDRIALIPARQQWQLAVNRAVMRRDRIALLAAFRDWKDRLPNAGRWLHVAMAASVSQRPTACLEALDNVDLEGSRYAATGWLWYLGATCYRGLESYGESLEQARQGRERFPDDGSLIISEVLALAALGRAEEVGRLIDENLSEPAADETFQLEQRFALLVDAGLAMKAYGCPEAATAALMRAVDWYSTTASEQVASSADRWRRARALYASGRWEEAQDEFSALSPDELAGDPRLMHHNIDVSLMGYRATLAARLGDDETAESIDDELERLRRPYLWGHATYWRAAVAAVRGEQERAVELLGQAMTEGLFAEPWGAEYPKWDYRTDPDFESLRDYSPFQELIAPRG